MDSFWPYYVWLIKIVFMNFTNSVINSSEDTKEHSKYSFIFCFVSFDIIK